MAPAEVDPYADRQSQNAVLDRVREATDHEIGDSENAGPFRERERECMTEREDYEDCLAGDFDTCIAAIRADLGVTEPVTAEILPIPPARPPDTIESPSPLRGRVKDYSNLLPLPKWGGRLASYSLRAEWGDIATPAAFARTPPTTAQIGVHCTLARNLIR